jgi:FkbM family methyltransferase
MNRKISELTQKMGLYGPLRTVKSRLDRVKPRNIRHRRLSQAFYGQFFDAGNLVFDVGANVGSRTEVFLDLGARVIAVEPQRACQGVLRRLFGRNKRFTLVTEALGERFGEAQMFVGDALVLSTLSAEWVSKMRESGRFGEFEWNKMESVPVRTMDSLIAEYGDPAFCKIDVEGFELEVIKGLTRPLRALSLEVAFEQIEAIIKALDCLDSRGQYEYNYSVSESMLMSMDRWIDGAQIRRYLRSELGSDTFGDVYARRTA